MKKIINLLVNWFIQKGWYTIPLVKDSEEYKSLLTRKYIANFISKQPPVKISNRTISNKCFICNNKFNCNGLIYYVEPICPDCEAWIRAGYIDEKELTIKLSRRENASVDS